MDELKNVIIQAQNGDLKAYGELIGRFQDMACGYAYSLLGDFHLAEDAAQEAFLQAYRDLKQLEHPEAFAGWFRKIVFKHCDRFTRGKRVAVVSLEAVGEPAGRSGAAETEMSEKVLAAIRGLPEDERTITTLFYINGYTQKDIAGFLDLTEGTVNNRLHKARNRLKERMMGMVERTLKSAAGGERFSQKVVATLLDRPRPLEMEGHPVRQVLQTIREVLPEYDYVEGEETMEKAFFLAMGRKAEDAYATTQDRVLRMSVADTMSRLLPGRTLPVRLITAGRVFKPHNDDREFPYHQAEVCCLNAEADERTMRAAIEKILTAVAGVREVKWEKTGERRFGEPFTRVYIKQGNTFRSVIACGLMTAKELLQYGYDPRQVEGFRFGIGLEALAGVKFGIEDKRAFWRPPYVP